MRILQVHNKYRPGWGGEDTVADLEADLLRRNGHEVERVSAWTKELEGANAFRLIVAGLGTTWSFSGYSKMKEAIARFSPDIVHVHNSFPLLSPSIFWAADKARVPVVHTLHNYRLTCANSLLLRDNKPCEECVGRFPWAALHYRCFGASFFRTAAVTSMNVVHRWLGTLRTKIHAYITLTEFSKEIMVRAGLPSERIYVKPNFGTDPGKLVMPRLPRVIFAGMMASFKGMHLLLEAWASLALAGYQLMMVGDGPDRAGLELRYAANQSIVWCGNQSREKVIDLIAGSRWLALPSLAYENFPMSMLEAFSVGTPVIVPNHGAFAAIVSDGVEGLLFSPGDTASLKKKLCTGLAASEADWTRWSANARNKYLRDCTDRSNYVQLMAIYRRAKECFQATRGRAGRSGSSDAVASIADLQER